MYSKYLKYKKKYLMLKQFGGNNFFAVYVFHNNLLNEETKHKMILSLNSLYPGEIEINTSPIYEDNAMSQSDLYRSEAIGFIIGKRGPSYTYITSFIIKNIPDEISSMNDENLTKLENDIMNKLTADGIREFKFPEIGEPDSDYRGWGLWSTGVAIITIVENAT
jgi:hypothetical protein